MTAAILPSSGATATSSGRSRGRPARRGRPSPLPWIGATMMLVVIGYVIIVPLLPLYDPYGQDLTMILLRPGQHPEHLLGTDSLGRDTASRLALAGRVTLLIVLAIIVANAVIGLIIGTVAGYFGGRLDNLLMAVADIQLALPVILVLIALSATFGPGVMLMVTVLSVTYWVGYARVARTAARSLRERDFVLAPKLLGAGTPHILRVHVLPGVLSQILILASTDLGQVILLMSSFDYLGLGIQAPTPSWGSMISESQKYLRQNVWQAVVPGTMIFLVVAGMNLFSQRFTSETAARHG
ncbi:ABC transporter permease [Microlunatus sp. GCM10028923]|uniref:ABC transporter permease n=1 Tax=Microlunatus sp. GCM10028923 TaxID=3273400 RepID=UPI003614CD3A